MTNAGYDAVQPAANCRSLSYALLGHARLHTFGRPQPSWAVCACLRITEIRCRKLWIRLEPPWSSPNQGAPARCRTTVFQRGLPCARLPVMPVSVWKSLLLLLVVALLASPALVIPPARAQAPNVD